jgi:hypothetical protein
MSDTATINRSREERVAELLEDAHRHQLLAAAYDAAAQALLTAEVPVAQYAPIWQKIAWRLHVDADTSRTLAARASDRLDDVQAAIVARERWEQDHR